MPRLKRRASKTVTISNPDKVLYPAGKFTRADVVDYYTRIARALLPHLKNRPITLKRFPNGVYGEAFYEKHAPGFTPDWVTTFPVPRREGGPDINYILINDVRTLKWAAKLLPTSLGKIWSVKISARAGAASPASGSSSRSILAL